VPIDDKSRAVILLLGFGITSSPVIDPARLAVAFGPTLATELEAFVRQVLDDVDDVDLDWTGLSLEAAGERAADFAHARYPELSDQALRAISWKVTFDWR